MFYRNITAVYSETHTTQTNMLCGQNEDFLLMRRHVLKGIKEYGVYGNNALDADIFPVNL